LTKKHQAKELFFTLPPANLPEPIRSSSHFKGGCRIQLERPDGLRLTLIMPMLDSTWAFGKSAQALRGSKMAFGQSWRVGAP